MKLLIVLLLVITVVSTLLAYRIGHRDAERWWKRHWVDQYVRSDVFVEVLEDGHRAYTLPPASVVTWRTISIPKAPVWQTVATGELKYTIFPEQQVHFISDGRRWNILDASPITIKDCTFEVTR